MERSEHSRLENRSLALHRAVADKIRRTPKLLAIPRANLSRWKRTAGRALPYLEEWERLIAAPLDELLQALTRDDERMRTLRQSTPFGGVLTPRERWKIYEAFRA